MAKTADFWLSSGFHLLRRNTDGKLSVTDDFLRAYFARPEMRPPEDSCAAEQALHAALTAEPRTAIDEQRLASLADADARDNYRHVLRLRDLLVAHGTVEACYLALFSGDGVAVPPLFIDQLAHAVLRNILDGCTDPLRLRAAEIFFRSQKVTLMEGAILAADEETVEMYAATGGMGGLGQLLVDSQTPMPSVDLDVLNDANGAIYWPRSDKFDTVLDLTFARSGLDALCRVLEAWVDHFLAVRIRVNPVGAIQDDRWVWHTGLDVDASRILNDLYQGQDVEEDRLARLISLFRLEFRDPAAMLPRIAGRPVYLALAMNGDQMLKMKPQNLLFNLPLAAAA